MLNYLHFKTLYFRQQNLDDLLVINVFKNKTGCSIMDSVGPRVPTKQNKDFSTFNVSMSQEALQQGVSQLQTASSLSLDVLNKHTISLEDTFSFA
jgi:hypothetical protein